MLGKTRKNKARLSLRAEIDKNIYFPLIILIIVALFVRGLWLDKFPPGISHDELELMLSAKTYHLYSKDVSGVAFPLSLIKTNLESGATGLVPFILSPLVGGMSMGLVGIRVIYALINVISGWFLMRLVNLFVKRREIGLISFAVFLLNPWSLLYSRYALAAPVALMFLLMGLYYLFKSKGKIAYRPIVLFALSIFSYYGAMPSVPPITFAAYIIHARIHGKKQINTNVKACALIIVLLLTFIFVSLKMPDSTISQRSREVSVLNLDRFSGGVNDSRRQSVSFPTKEAFINKGTFFITEASEKYINAFSPTFLFLSGDPRASYNLGYHGHFYLFETILMIIGVIGIYKYSGKLLPLLLSMIIFAPLGSLMTVIEDSYIFRSFMLLPGLVLLVTFGIWFAYESAAGRWKKFFPTVLTIIYLVFFVNFLVDFFFRYSVVEAENHYTSERVLANYLVRSKEKAIVVVENPLNIYEQYVWFSNNLNDLENLNYEDNGFVSEGVEITGECPDGEDYETLLVIQPSVNCEVDRGSVVIQDAKDSGTMYEIFNGSLCDASQAERFRADHRVSDYEMEQMTNEEFCQRWIFKY